MNNFLLKQINTNWIKMNNKNVIKINKYKK